MTFTRKAFTLSFRTNHHPHHMTASNALTYAALPIDDAPHWERKVGETVVAKTALSRPTIYDAAGEYKPRIGVIVEINAHIVAIHWDGYPAPWDYSARELEGRIIRLTLPVRGQIIPRGHRRSVPAYARSSDGWIVTPDGDMIPPTQL